MKNFGQLKKTFNNILSENIVDKDEKKKKLFKKYVKLLKEDEILKTQFNVFLKIETLSEENTFKAGEKIKKIVEGLNKFNKKDIIESNKKLLKILAGIDIVKEYDGDVLHEHITNLIFSDDVDTYVDSLNEAVEYAKSNKEVKIVESLNMPNNLLSVVLVNAFNNEYSELSESDKEIINLIFESDDEKRKKFFDEKVHECMTLVNENLKVSDLDLKESLLTVKEKLLTFEYDSSSFEKNIIKLVKLTNDLNS